MTVFGDGLIMVSGDPFILYVPNGTAQPYTYQPAAGVTLVLTAFSGINCEWYSTQNAVAYSRFLGNSKNVASYASGKNMIDNTTYLWCVDADMTSYGNHISGIEL